MTRLFPCSGCVRVRNAVAAAWTGLPCRPFCPPMQVSRGGESRPRLRVITKIAVTSRTAWRVSRSPVACGTCFVDHSSSVTTSCVLLGPPVTVSSRVPPQATAAGSACAPGKAGPWLGRLHPGQPLPPPRASCHHYRALGRGDMLVVFRQGHWLG